MPPQRSRPLFPTEQGEHDVESGHSEPCGPLRTRGSDGASAPPPTLSRKTASSRLPRGGRSSAYKCYLGGAGRRPSKPRPDRRDGPRRPSGSRRSGRSGGKKPAADVAGCRTAAASGSGWQRACRRRKRRPRRRASIPAASRRPARPATIRTQRLTMAAWVASLSIYFGVDMRQLEGRSVIR